MTWGKQIKTGIRYKKYSTSLIILTKAEYSLHYWFWTLNVFLAPEKGKITNMMMIKKPPRKIQKLPHLMWNVASASKLNFWKIVACKKPFNTLCSDLIGFWQQGWPKYWTMTETLILTIYLLSSLLMCLLLSMYSRLTKPSSHFSLLKKCIQEIE